MTDLDPTPSDPDIETLIAAFYAAFDNRGSRVPDAAALRAMFGAGATVTRMTGGAAEVWDVEAFLAPRVAMLSDGRLADFHEWEVEARTVVRGAIASRWSRYAKAGRLDGASCGGGGEKFIQLRREAGGWKISAILWEDAAGA